MLIEFTVGNFLSFKEKKTLSLVASSIKEFEDTNVISAGKDNFLTGAVIYGANASGKSNLIKAMSTMRRLVMHFFRPSTAELDVTPFLLNSSTENSPSYFEVLFLLDDTRYRYGFEVDNIIVRSEWLYHSKVNVEKPLFVRDGQDIEVMKPFSEGKNLEEKTRDNALFLTVVDQFNGTIATKIMNWFNNFVSISGLSHERYTEVTFDMLENENTKPLLQKFYDNLDLGFDDLKLIKKDFDSSKLPKDFPEPLMEELSKRLEGQTIVNVRTLHKKFDSNNKQDGVVEFDMDSQESAGTNKMFNISGPIFDVLTGGGVLVVDELDSSLHPLLTLAITKLFNSKEHNHNNAQLIFATHDTNLLCYGTYRRDQIYFMEKDQFGVSDLYSLVEYKEDGKTVRKDRSFESDYIEGRYGAIPFVGDLSNILA